VTRPMPLELPVTTAILSFTMLAAKSLRSHHSDESARFKPQSLQSSLTIREDNKFAAYTITFTTEARKTRNFLRFVFRPRRFLSCTFVPSLLAYSGNVPCFRGEPEERTNSCQLIRLSPGRTKSHRQKASWGS